MRYVSFSTVIGVAHCNPRSSVRAEHPPRCWLRIEANDDGSWGIFRVLDRRARLLYSKWGTQVGCRHHGMFDADQRPPLPGAQHDTTHWHPGSHRSNAMKRLSLVLASAILLIASIQIDPSVAQQTSTSNRAAPSANLVLIPGAMAGARTMGPTGYRRLCAPLSVGLYEWRVQWLERLLKPNNVHK